MEEQKPSPEKGTEDEQTAATPPRIDAAACATLMKHIGKKYVVKDPVIAVQIEETFDIGQQTFPAGSYIVELKSDVDALGGAKRVFIGMVDRAFNVVYRPARKPRKA